MEQRVLGRTGRLVSVIGLGTWQLGADWGNVSEADAMAVLRTAVESGVTFFDTADVYGDGRSERITGRFLADNAGQGITVATKMGRRVEQKEELYTLENFRAWTDRSRVNLGTDRLDLVQLHCPPTAVFSSDAVFDALDTLVAEERGDVFRRGIRGRRGRRGRVHGHHRRPARREPGPVGAAVGNPAAGGDDRGPRRAEHRSGQAKRRGGEPAAAAAGRTRRDRGTVRQVLPRHGARPLVSATGRSLGYGALSQ
jgi:hypothetical protein